MNIATVPEALQRRLSRGAGPHAGLIRGSAASVGLQLAHTLLALLAGVVLARALGPNGYGTYAYVFALVSLLAIPAQAGLPQLVVRETAKAHAGEEWGLMRGLWRWVTRVSLSSSLLLALAAGGVAWLFADYFNAVQLKTLAWGLLLVPLIALGNLRGAALRGVGRVVRGQLPEFVLRPGLLTIFIALAWSGTARLTPDGAMSLHALAAVAAFAAGLWLLHQSRPAPAGVATTAVYQGRRWIASALPLAFIAAVRVINSQTDILMLGALGDAEQVGIYRVAVQGAAFVTLGLSAANMVVAPQFAQLYARADMARLQQVATVSSRIVLSLTLPVAAIFLGLGKPILAQVFGDGYVTGYGPLAILTIGQLINAAFGSVAFLLNMTGHEQSTARIVAVTATCNVALNLALIPPLGLNGAASATALTTFLLNLLLWHSLRRQLGVDSTALALRSKARLERPGNASVV